MLGWQQLPAVVQTLPLSQPQVPPQPSLPPQAPGAHEGVHTHWPPWQLVPAPQVPQVPPQPSLPHTLLPQLGVHTQALFTHDWPAAHGPQVPPQPSATPQAPGAQLGVQVGVVGVHSTAGVACR